MSTRQILKQRREWQFWWVVYVERKDMQKNYITGNVKNGEINKKHEPMDLGHYCFGFSKEGQCSKEENIAMIQKKKYLYCKYNLQV